MKQKVSFRLFLVWIPAILICLYSVLPLGWAFITSIKPAAEIHTPVIQYWPRNPTFESYLAVFKTTDFISQFKNSAIVAGCTTLFCVFISVTASYAFSRFHFKGSKVLRTFFLSSQMFPKVLIIIPLFVIMRGLHLLNTKGSLVFAYTSFSLPYVIYMLIGYFAGIPQELDEAATIDGCTRTGILFKIILPLALPGIIATAIYAFIHAWDELMFAVMFTSTAAQRTLPVGLSMYIGEYGIEWGNLCAASIMTSLPVVILFMFLQRFLIAGMTNGGVKE